MERHKTPGPPRQLAERVRRETGQSVGDWLTLFRLAHARTLLRTSDPAVEAVALEWRTPT